MDLSALFYSLGGSATFSSRAFLPMFITAVSLRYGDKIPYIKGSDFIQSISHEPTWFTNNWTIVALAILAGLEIAADKMPEARLALDKTLQYAKTGAAGLAYMGVVSSSDLAFIDNSLQQAGFGDLIITGFVSFVVYVISGWRNAIVGILVEADEDDDLGIQRLISWFEDLWASLGIIMVLLFPIVMLLACALIAVIFALLAGWAKRRDEKSKIECPTCRHKIYQSALQCPQCKTENEGPKKLGILAAPIDKPVEDRQVHAFECVEKKRCPVCSTRFPKKAVEQTCRACGHELFIDKEFAHQYLARIRSRLPLTLGVTFLLSLVPVIGLIPGIIYYRYKLAGPFRRYLPLHKNLILKILIQLIIIALIAAQWVPGLGGFAVPLMALITYAMYAGSYRLAISKRTRQIES